MKKIAMILFSMLVSLSLVACSTETEEPKQEEKPKKEAIVLSDDETSKAIETIKYMCEDTVYDKADIKLVTEQQEEFTTTNNVLKVIVIKDRTEVETYFRLNGGEDTVEKSIKKALHLDTAVSAASENNSKITEFDRVVAVLYSTEEDFKNDKSYAVDVLELN